MGGKRNVCRGLVGKPEGKRPLGRPRHRSEDNTQMSIKQNVKAGTGLIVVQDTEQWLALVETALNLQVPLHVGNILATISLPKRAVLHRAGCEQRILDALVDKEMSHPCFECSSRIFLIHNTVCN